MLASRLKLEHYNLTHIQIEPVGQAEATALGSYAEFKDANFGSNVTVSQIEGPAGEQRHLIELKLRAIPKEDAKGFAYKIRIGLVGIFDGRELPAENRENLIKINGASMLYGVAREMVLNLTARALHGSVLMPTVTFVDLEQAAAVPHQIEEVKAG